MSRLERLVESTETWSRPLGRPLVVSTPQHEVFVIVHDDTAFTTLLGQKLNLTLIEQRLRTPWVRIQTIIRPWCSVEWLTVTSVAAERAHDDI